MTACSDPPNRPTSDVIDRLVDQVAWAKTCLLTTAATAPGTAEREWELAKLRAAVAPPRETVDAIFTRGQAVPRTVLIELRTCELAIPKLEQGAVLRRQSGEGS